jgi:soluble lytic murein transglycosylase-like protein
VIAAFLQAARLASAIMTAHPDVPVDRAASAALAIVATVPAEDRALVAALAWRESRFVATAHNACCAGPMAVRGFDVRRGELAGYRAGVAALTEARRWCLRRRTPTTACALAAYAGGPRLVRRGGYTGARVLRDAARVRRAMARLAPRVRREGARS